MALSHAALRVARSPQPLSQLPTPQKGWEPLQTALPSLLPSTRPPHLHLLIQLVLQLLHPPRQLSLLGAGGSRVLRRHLQKMLYLVANPGLWNWTEAAGAGLGLASKSAPPEEGSQSPFTPFSVSSIEGSSSLRGFVVAIQPGPPAVSGPPQTTSLSDPCKQPPHHHLPFHLPQELPRG